MLVNINSDWGNLMPRAVGRHTTVAAVAVCVAACGALALPEESRATPVRNATPWSVLLCKLKDVAAEPQQPAYFADLLTDAGRGKGGVADYLEDQSFGQVSLAGSEVRGWFTEPYTLADDLALGGSEGRWARVQRCVDTAVTAGYQVPAGNRIAVVVNLNTQGGEVGGRILLPPDGWNVGFVAHQMLHVYGLGHSFSNDLAYRDSSSSQPGEYDDQWDVMSGENVHAFPTARFGSGGVGLSGAHRDELGWISQDQVVNLGADGAGSRSVALAPLEAPSYSYYSNLLIRIPFNIDDPFNYYTVEYRRKTGWSAGIPSNTILIHEVRNGTPYLLRASDASRSPLQALDTNGVKISVQSIGTSRARVTVSTDLVDRCLKGYVWREASPTDQVCVTPETRSQVAADNAAAVSRWVDGDYGPHTCVAGYVWRKAYEGDQVCATPAQREQAALDNDQAQSRTNPAARTTGPNTCVAGYVWREGDIFDYVCVTPETRSQFAADNAAAVSRWVDGDYGPHTCVAGYVWRMAYPGDEVCVTPAQRSQAGADNASARSRVARPAG
jgi:hypothetical protein